MSEAGEKGKTFKEWIEQRPKSSPASKGPSGDRRHRDRERDRVRTMTVSMSNTMPAPPSFRMGSEDDSRYSPVPIPEGYFKMKKNLQPTPPPKKDEKSAEPSGKWRSLAIYHEVRLKELLADDNRLPSITRLNKVLQHYVDVTAIFPLFKNVFELILSEVYLSIFSTSVDSLGTVNTAPYFELATSLKKDVEQSNSELLDAKRDANQDTLHFELQTAKSRNRYVAHQLDRLNQENEALLEDVAKLNHENEMVAKNGRQAFIDLEQQNRSVETELRKLEKENVLMKYEERMKKSHLAEYTHLKLNQMSCVTAMLHPSYEHSSYLQLMIQLEAAENRLLDDFDVNTRTLPAQDVPPARTKMVNKLRVLQEELFELERYSELLLQDVDVEMPHGDDNLDDLFHVLNGDRNEDREAFVRRTLKGAPSSAQNILLTTVESIATQIVGGDPIAAIKDKLTVPLLENDPRKYDNRIEISVVVGCSNQTEHVKTISTVDPCANIDLPSKSTSLNLKFSRPNACIPRPLRKQLTENQAAHLEEELASRSSLAENIRKVLPSTFMEGLGGRELGNHASWAGYVNVFGSWVPRLPRILSRQVVEEIIFDTYTYHATAVQTRYLESKKLNIKEAQENTFTSSLKQTDMLEALVKVLEKRYHLPLVGNKYAFELMSTCERMDTVLTAEYLNTCSGTDVATGRVTSIILHLLRVNWPALVPDEAPAITQKELTNVIENMYSTLSQSKVEEILSDIAIHTKAVFTYATLRDYFITSLTTMQEYHTKALAEMVEFKAKTLKWSELDKYAFADSCSSYDFGRDSDMARMREHLKYRHTEACIRGGAQKSRLSTSELAMLASEAMWTLMTVSHNTWLKPRQNAS